MKKFDRGVISIPAASATLFTPNPIQIQVGGETRAVSVDWLSMARRVPDLKRGKNGNT